MRIGLLVPLMLSGCGTLFSGFNAYCEEKADCMDGNEEDEKACVVDIQNTRRISRVYGCEDDYMDYMECMKEDADCESEGRYDYWTDEGECNDDLEDYLDCLSDESDVIGGSGGGDYDTGSWGGSSGGSGGGSDWDDIGADSCSIAGGIVCVEPNEPDNEAWCNGLPADYSAEYSADSCSTTGVTGICTDVGAVGDYTSSGATIYYYEGVDGSDACIDMGGTFTEY